MEEIAAAGNKLGYDISDEAVVASIERTYKMGAYKPSSLVDFSNGREVEVEAIWGLFFFSNIISSS